MPNGLRITLHRVIPAREIEKGDCKAPKKGGNSGITSYQNKTELIST